MKLTNHTKPVTCADAQGVFLNLKHIYRQTHNYITGFSQTQKRPAYLFIKTARQWRYATLVFCVLSVLFVPQKADAQRIIQFYYNIFNPLMIDGTGYSGQSAGTNILIDKFGFEFDYGFTRKKREDRYTYFNPKVKYQFSDKKKNREVHVYHYATLGFKRFTAIKNNTFWGRSADLRPPYYDSTETALTYNNYGVLAETQSSMIEFGYEKVAEKHLSGVAQGKVAILDPFGFIIGWFSGGSSSSYEFSYTRTFRFSLFAGPKSWMKIRANGYEQSGGSGAILSPESETVVLEPSLVNLLGCRVGYQWTTLNPVGTSLGIEMALLPGVFNRHGVYGVGFPDDNIYIKINLGIGIGIDKKK